MNEEELEDLDKLLEEEPPETLPSEGKPESEEEEEQQILVTENNWTPLTFVHFGPSSRRIMLSTDVNEHSAMAIASQVMELDSIGNEEPIILYINTFGGCVYNAFSLYDTLRSVEAPIVTIATGRCMSAGLLLLQAGDIRLATPNTRFLYHEAIAEMQVQRTYDMQAFSQNYLWIIKTYNSIIRKRAALSKRKWKKVFRGHTSLMFDTKFALKYNLIDDIVPLENKSCTIALEKDNG